MSRRSGTSGSGLVELLVGTALAMIVLTLLTAAFAVGGRVLTHGAARGELEDITHIAVESLTFDVRRAGFDPTGSGLHPIGEAYADRITLTADLDDDGAVATDSEETVTYVCTPGARRFSRIVGHQSLPIADGVTACRFRYLDAGGNPLTTPPAGLPAADRARIRAVALDLTVGAPGLTTPATRTTLVGLRASS